MLYIVPTPIGNLEDITVRGLKVLQSAEYIICEDPRGIDKLLTLLAIRGQQRYIQLIRNHTFNTHEVCTLLQNALDSDIEIALVTDAGTPVISDPGYEVIQIAQELGLAYTVLPGATSIITAGVASGLISKEFVYLGFLPLKKGRQKTWEYIIRSQYPVILLESVHRIPKLVQEIQTKLPSETQVFIGRELTKKFETYLRTTAGELVPDMIEQRGEFVIVIKPLKNLTSTASNDT